MIRLERKRDTLAMNLTYAEQRALEIGITIAGGAERRPARRADRRHEQERDGALHRADPRGHRRQDAAHRRARHGRRLRPGRQDRGARLRRGDRLRRPEAVRANRACRRRISARCTPTPRTPEHEDTTMLELADLHAYYGKSHILHGVDMRVGEGEIVSLLGRNGSGRSTTVKTIMGLVHGEGSITPARRGDPRPQDLRHRPPRHRLRAREPRHLPQADGAPEPAARREARARRRRAGPSTTCTGCSRA